MTLRRASTLKFLSLLTLLVLLLGACGRGNRAETTEPNPLPTVEESANTAENTNPPADAPTNTPEPEPEANTGNSGGDNSGSDSGDGAGGVTSSGEASGDAAPAAPPQISGDALAGLDSYRSTIDWRAELSGGIVQQSKMEIEETRNPPARRMIVDSQGQEFEMVQVESNLWVKIAGTWQQLPQEAVEGFFGDAVFVRPEDMSDLAAQEGGTYEYVGTETINDLPTQHYRFSLDPAQAAQVEQFSGAQQISGDIWVVDDPNLPSFAARMNINYETSTQGQESKISVEWNVSDVNSGLTIDPPN